jgi:pimeloyl-ACP methyl ester carboxylesterase
VIKAKSDILGFRQRSTEAKGRELLFCCSCPARPHLRPADGKLAVIGFSWGGWKSFAYATHRKDLNAVFVFYGTGPEDGAAISAPVYGFYAGEDAGVDVTIPATIAAMKAANKFYDPITYEGAEHGYQAALRKRQGDRGRGSEASLSFARGIADRRLRLCRNFSHVHRGSFPKPCVRQTDYSFKWKVPTGN